MLEGTINHESVEQMVLTTTAIYYRKRNNTKSRHHNYGDDKRCIAYMYMYPIISNAEKILNNLFLIGNMKVK